MACCQRRHSRSKILGRLIASGALLDGDQWHVGHRSDGAFEVGVLFRDLRIFGALRCPLIPGRPPFRRTASLFATGTSSTSRTSFVAILHNPGPIADRVAAATVPRISSSPRNPSYSLAVSARIYKHERLAGRTSLERWRPRHRLSAWPFGLSHPG
jgi:hypothetical protein